MLIGQPLADAGPVDWLADLFRAGGFHGARIAVEIQARPIEGKVEIVEQPTNLTFGVFNEMLIFYAMNCARIDCVEMAEQISVQILEIESRRRRRNGAVLQKEGVALGTDGLRLWRRHLQPP